MSDTTNPWEKDGETPESRSWLLVQEIFDADMGHIDPRDAALYICEAIEAACAQALADAAPKVEWLPVDGRKHDCIDLYVTDGKRVGFVERWHDIPKGTTHYAICPAREMPAPPKEDAP